MKTRKMVVIKTMIQVIIVIGYVFALQKREPSGKKCTLENIVLAMETFRGQTTGFEDLHKAININFCDIEKDKLRNYLMRFIAELKVDSIYSEEYKKNISSASFYLKSESGWNRDVEELYSEKMKYYKEKRRMISFYRFAGVLIEKGEKWYDYIAEVIDNTDNDQYFERRRVYRSLTKRIEGMKNPAERKKAISILYAISKTDCGAISVIDDYFTKIEPKYKNSTQRFHILQKCADVFKGLPEENGYKKYLKENYKAKDEAKFRNDYTPPLDLPELSPSE